MKNILSFLSYHNAIPLAAVVLTMGAGITFAASQGVLPLAVPTASLTDTLAEGVDAATLRALDLDAFDFHPTVTGVVETDSLYTVSYSIETLAPEGNEWTSVSKTGEFSVAKDALGDGGLNSYAVGKLHDIENGERSYLARAQAAEKALAQTHEARPASAFTALVGLALDQIPVPVVEKPVPEPQPEVPSVQPIPTPVEIVAPASTSEESIPAPEVATSTPDTPESKATSTDQTIQPTESDSATAPTTESIATSTPESN
jgi:hypothetical protein